MKLSRESSQPGPKLSTTLATAFFSFSIVLLLLYGGFEVYQGFKIQEAFLYTKQQLIAQNAAGSLSDFIQENFDSMETGVWLTNLYQAPPAQQGQILQGLLGIRPALRWLVLLNDQGQIVMQASRLSMEASTQLALQLKSFVSTRNGASKRSISPVYIDRVTYEPMVTMAVSVTDVLGDFRGTLLAELNLKSMWDIVDQLKVGRTGYAYVTDRRGSLLAFHDTARVLRSENVSHVKAVEEFMSDRTSTGPGIASQYQGIGGTTVVGTYAPMRMPDWAVVVELPWSEAYEGVVRNVIRAVAETLAIAVLAGIFGMYVARRLAVPVTNLTETASRIAAGERDLRAAVGGPKEVAQLAAAFNSMTGQLGKSLQDVEQQFADLKRTEAALRLSEERLRLALEGTSDGIWDWNPQTGQAYFSPRYYTMLGYEPDEFPASYDSWRGLLHPQDSRETLATVHHAVAERSSFATTFRFKAKDGTWHWILARGKVAEQDEEGNAVRVAGSHTDITALKQAEEGLRNYERIVSTSQDLMALISRDYVFNAVNESLLKAYQMPREQVVGRTVMEIRGGDLFKDKIQPWIDKALSGQTVHYQSLFEFAGLGRRNMDITYFPMFDETGAVEGVVLNARDVTETRKLEEQLVQSQRIESIGTLAGGVAHEINNPINGIMNYAQLILDRPENQGVTKEYAKEILHETKRVAQIVRNLLTFARYENQAHSPAQLSDIVASVLSLIQTVMRHDQIILELDVSDDLPKVKCRSQQIQQVLMNLMTNARDALNERYPDYSTEKKLRIVASVIVKAGRRFVRTTVEDGGTGIPKEIRNRIFDPFFTTKPKGTGTGLGLSISYGIVRDHGGDLSVEIKPGGVTRFHMDLPVDNGWRLDES